MKQIYIGWTLMLVLSFGFGCGSEQDASFDMSNELQTGEVVSFTDEVAPDEMAVRAQVPAKKRRDAAIAAMKKHARKQQED